MRQFNKPLFWLAAGALTLVGGLQNTFAGSSNRAQLDERVQRSVTVLDEHLSDADNAIPDSLLERATCVFVIPDAIKAGFIGGGQGGRGLVSCRTPDGWSNPSFTHLGGGSVGFLVGIQAADIVLVFINRSAPEQLSKGNFTLGANASIAIGPLGRNLQAGTDYELKSEIYSYSRSRGLYLGVSLDGTVIDPSSTENSSFYGQSISATELLSTTDPLSTSSDVAEFTERLQRYGSHASFAEAK